MPRHLSVAIMGLLLSACASAPSPRLDASTANLAAARRLYADFLAGDIAAVQAAMADDVVWTIPGPATLPYAGTRHGKAEWQGYLQGLGAADIVSFEPQRFLAEGDTVVVLGRESLKVKATGKIFSGDWAQALTFRDGKLVRFQSFDDTAAAVDAFTTAR